MKRSDYQNIIKLHESSQQQEDEPVMEVDEDGVQLWRSMGELHRDNGPTLIYSDGSRVWYNNNNIHRIDGPSHIYSDGELRWYIKNRRYNNIEDWAKAALEYQHLPSDEAAVKQYVQKVLNNITDEEI